MAYKLVMSLIRIGKTIGCLPKELNSILTEEMMELKNDLEELSTSVEAFSETNFHITDSLKERREFIDDLKTYIRQFLEDIDMEAQDIEECTW